MLPDARDAGDVLDVRENALPEYTLLMLMPPRNAVSPSTTSSLRWLRRLICQSAPARAGFSGLKASTRTPASLRVLKKVSGVPSVPRLS